MMDYRIQEPANRRSFSLILILTSFALLVAVFGCSEKDVPVVSDSNEILSYLDREPDALELFKNDEVFNSDTFTVTGDPGAYYVEIVDSVQRSISLDMTPVGVITDYSRYGSWLSYTRDTEARILDRFFITRRRTSGAGSTDSSYEWNYLRHALFLKVGDDSQVYLGWQLWGYNGGEGYRSLMDVVVSGGSSFFGDIRGYRRLQYLRIEEVQDPQTGNYYMDTTAGTTNRPYLRVSEFERIPRGTMLYPTTEITQDKAYYLLMSAEANSGSITNKMGIGNNGAYVDSLRTPLSGNRLYDLIFFREIWDASGQFDGWAVPYRNDNKFVT